MTTPADEPKQYVVAHVREALAAHANLNELNVEVSVAGGKVFLTGVVGTEERRRALERVVAEVAAGYEVHNQTELASFAEAEEAEELS